MRSNGPAEAAVLHDAILAGTATPGMRYSGRLDFRDEDGLTVLPEQLTVQRLNVVGCTKLQALPPGLHCYELDISMTPIAALPEDIQVDYALGAHTCTNLTSLPAGLTTGMLILRNCTALQTLPENLTCNTLDLTNCTAFSDWPAHAAISMGFVQLRGCTNITHLPEWLTNLAGLDISGCVRLTSLPPNLHISAWLDVADCGVTSLPPSLAEVALRWRGVPISARIAFQPESLTVDEIIAEPNLEIRRIMIERIGYERYLEAVQAEMLDADHDPGGERQLLRVDQGEDEDLVLLAVRDPSTGNRYLLRVPPQMTSCRQAAAWIAGFDDPDGYHPLAET